MDPLTAFLCGFGACLLLWLTTEVSWPRRRELEATPEEEFGLDPKNPCSILVLAYRPVFVPTRGRLLDRYGRARRKSKPNDKEPREGLVGAYEHNLSTS
jgi:hypothetical protein